MPEPSAAERLRALAQGNTQRSDSARLREILADVEAALSAGVSRAAILEELHAAGFTFKQSSFEWALYQARKKKKSNPSTGTLKQQRTEASTPTQTNQDMKTDPIPTQPEPDPSTKRLTRKQIADQIGAQYVNETSSLASNPIIRRLLEKEKQDQEKT
jgi:hypothetical protein